MGTASRPPSASLPPNQQQPVSEQQQEQEQQDPQILEAEARLEFAQYLNKCLSFPLIPFSQDADGVFRCIVPQPEKVQLVQLVRPQTTPHHFARFLAPRKFRSKLEEDLEERIYNYKVNGTERLMESLEKFKKSEKRKKLDFIKKCGREFVVENSQGLSDFSSEQMRRRAVLSERRLLLRDVTVQKRNVRQYEIVQRRAAQTREAINARKMREAAMAEFIEKQTLTKNNSIIKAWLGVIVMSNTAGMQEKALKAFRHKVQPNKNLRAIQAVTLFLNNRVKQYRRRVAADEIVGFLTFIKRDGQIKGIAKKLTWILVKLQKLMLSRIECNHIRVVLLKKKYNLVVTKYLEDEEMKRLEFEARVEKISNAKKREAMEKKIPKVKVPLPDELISQGILDWIIKNRQLHVTKTMQYEEYELWPILTSLVREKALFGNQLEARKFAVNLRRRGKMKEWILENGGGEDLGEEPRYRRIPSDEEIIRDIYEKCRADWEVKRKQDEEMEKMMAALHREIDIGLGADGGDGTGNDGTNDGKSGTKNKKATDGKGAGGKRRTMRRSRQGSGASGGAPSAGGRVRRNSLTGGRNRTGSSASVQEEDSKTSVGTEGSKGRRGSVTRRKSVLKGR